VAAWRRVRPGATHGVQQKETPAILYFQLLRGLAEAVDGHDAVRMEHQPGQEGPQLADVADIGQGGAANPRPDGLRPPGFSWPGGFS
jgi:hypothetical protein